MRTYLSLLTDRSLLRRTIRPVLAFIAIGGMGIAGFMALGNIGVIEAAFWLLDPTSIELHFREQPGPEMLTKLYALAATSGLIVTSLWAGETVLAAAFGGQIRTELQHARNQQRIMDLENHVVICGYGMFGRTIARNLATNDRDIVVIELDEGVAEQAHDDGHLVVEGDARQETTLKESGIRQADSLVAAVDDSNVNVQVVIASRQLAPNLTITVRVGSEMYDSLAHQAGGDYVVIPEVVSGEDIADQL